MKNILKICIVLVLAGCVSFNKNDSRYIGNAIDDNSISLRVNDALFKQDHTYFMDVNVTVFNDRVMLVGVVENSAAKKEVLAKASGVSGVKEVIDHIMIEGKEEGKVGFSWVIHKAIVAKLLADKDIASNNFKVVVFRKIAYVIGEAKSGIEKNKVLRIIQNTDGVMGVKNNITIK